MKVAASEDAGPAGTADGAGGEGVEELHPGLGDHLPGRDQWSCAAHGGVLVVSEDQDNVGSPGGGPGHHTHSNIVLSPRPAPVGIKPAVWPVRLPPASFPGAELVAENVVTTEIEI